MNFYNSNFLLIKWYVGLPLKQKFQNVIKKNYVENLCRENIAHGYGVFILCTHIFTKRASFYYNSTLFLVSYLSSVINNNNVAFV